MTFSLEYITIILNNKQRKGQVFEMKKFFRSVISILLCICMLVPISGYAAAANVGQVKNLKVKSTTSSTVTLSWTKTSGAKRYRVYRYDTSENKWVQVTTTSSTSYKVTNLSSAKSYKFRVRAYNGDTKGSYSSSVTAVTAPKKVTSLTYSSTTSSSATLKWDKVTRATGYTVYKYNSTDKTWKVLKSTTSTSYTVKGLSSGKTYKFMVRAYVKSGDTTKYGSSSDSISVSIKLGQVKNLKVTDVTSTGYTLEWSKVDNADRYDVYRYETAGWTKIFSTNLTYYKVKNASSSSKKYRVRAVRESGSKVITGPYSATVSAKTSLSTSESALKPSVPQNLSLVAVPGDKSISISWDKTDLAKGYQVYKYNESENEWVRIRTTSSTSIKYSVDETGIYKFKVRAYNTVNNKTVYGEFSKESEVYYISDNKEDVDSALSDIEKTGVLGYLYDADNHCFYTATNAWQRNFGFTPVYDYCAPFTIMFYNTIRLKFEYDNLEWMIQIWKGQYGWVFIGAEIGVYTRSSSLPLDFYICADDEHMLNMSMVVRHNDVSIIRRPYEKYWWCTGFVPGMLPSAILGAATGNIDTSSLTMNARITMKDEEMRDAFCKALEKNGFVLGKTYFYAGLDVIFVWN